MDFSLNEEQKQTMALVRQFCQKEIDQKQLEEMAAKTSAARNMEELRNVYIFKET